jgi:RNA polymerase sigma-70 factor (ECF subfamily)
MERQERQNLEERGSREAEASDTRASEERVLIEKAKRGDRASQETLVMRYERRVYALVLSMVRNSEDARDLVQETFVKALTNLHRFDFSATFPAWLMRIAANGAKDFLRRRGRESRIFAYETEDMSVEDFGTVKGRAEAALSARIDSAVVERCMAGLDPRYASVLTLRYRDGYAYKEIGDILSIPMGTVKVLIHRGRQELKRAVKREVGEL